MLNQGHQMEAPLYCVFCNSVMPTDGRLQAETHKIWNCLCQDVSLSDSHVDIFLPYLPYSEEMKWGLFCVSPHNIWKQEWFSQKRWPLLGNGLINTFPWQWKNMQQYKNCWMQCLLCGLCHIRCLKCNERYLHHSPACHKWRFKGNLVSNETVS
jgi:hypothetical protein